ncbi:hypothetical protein [Lutibacter sp.]|uniref:hypothetical protein n=1 Tax=Lutibacter sp. TaxID=1925666 RepID=UPI0025C2ABEB|nr:hypothetical protein [Lutibacter sp.]MCF6169294.1 hypothetical protein [Lutibacter sp.]
MRKLIFSIKAIVFILIFQSCDNIDFGGNPPPTCEWDEENQVVFYDLQLSFPSGLSNWHSNLIPIDKIERSLNSIIEVNGNVGSSSQAKISVTMKSDGTSCIGEKSVAFMKGASEVGISNIVVPFVSNAVFIGEVTVGIRTDTFVNTVGNGNYYHVLWSGAGNDPNGRIVGNISGTKVTYGNFNGTTSIVISKDGSYIKNGQKVYM